MNGRNAGSASVQRLPSRSAFGIAVSGRQNTYLYLVSITATRASLIAMFSSAKRRALNDSDWRFCSVTCATAGFHVATASTTL